ncbi:glycosyltransferase family 39 protein [Candidatus Woesearchaeota archaeon]|nr:glycosyltransferase family 39 protein [Candidatus Woesearchaeota archaeon]
MRLRSNIGIIIVILAFICANAVFLNFYKDVWWDSSVYIGMGKYIFSSGKSGLWEESRPLILPFILGIGWKLGFDAVYFARLVSIIFAILVICMTYAIGLKVFSKKIGLLAAFFTAFSYNFLFFSPNILTEIPSMLFLLLALYFFMENKFFFMGLAAGIAVMTRFFQFFTLIGLGIIFIISIHRKPKSAKKLFYGAAGFLILVLPYFILNYYLYNDMFEPFKVQAHLTRATTWAHYQEFPFYIKGLLKENFFLVLLLSLPLFPRKDRGFTAVFLIPAIYLFIFSIAKNKDMRYAILVMPFLYLLLSYCLMKIHGKIKYKKLASAFFILVLAAWTATTFMSFNDAVRYTYQRNDEGFLYFQDYLKNNNGNVWTTNPLYALYSGQKIGGLLYFYSSEKLIDFINKNKNNVDIVLFNSCDIPCPPAEADPLCGESREILYNAVSKFRKIYEKGINSCRYEIYRKATSLF